MLADKLLATLCLPLSPAPPSVTKLPHTSENQTTYNANHNHNVVKCITML